MNRREIREQIFLLLFRVEFNELEDMPEQIKLFFDTSESSTEEDKFQMEICQKYEDIVSRKTEIDDLIAQKAVGWTVSRMGKVDLTILRLAVYEILFDESIPTSVAINEAVELAKKFGQDESSAFINVVLAKFA